MLDHPLIIKAIGCTTYNGKNALVLPRFMYKLTDYLTIAKPSFKQKLKIIYYIAECLLCLDIYNLYPNINPNNIMVFLLLNLLIEINK